MKQEATCVTCQLTLAKNNSSYANPKREKEQEKIEEKKALNAQKLTCFFSSYSHFLHTIVRSNCCCCCFSFGLKSRMSSKWKNTCEKRKSGKLFLSFHMISCCLSAITHKQQLYNICLCCIHTNKLRWPLFSLFFSFFLSFFCSFRPKTTLSALNVFFIGKQVINSHKTTTTTRAQTTTSVQFISLIGQRKRERKRKKKCC